MIDPLLQVGRAGPRLVPSPARAEPHPLPRNPAPTPEPAQAAGPARDVDAEIQLILDAKIFDADWYRRGVGLAITDTAQLVRHYLMSAGPDRWTPNPLFDLAFYTRNHGHELDGLDPFVHYLRVGWTRGYDPHPLFDIRFYLERNSDVRAAGVEPLFHYTVHGWREGRWPCPEFDVAYYLETYDDVRTRDYEPLRHYVEYGAAEGRDPSAVFETRWYARRVLNGAATNPLAHFRATGSDPDVLLRDIVLDARHAMSQADFERWTRTFRSSNDAGTQADEIIRVHAAARGENRGASSLAAARALSQAARTAPSGARHVYVVCEADDEIDDVLLPHLSRRMERAELVTFDFAFRRDAGWTPVLLPGANAVQIEAVDATFSRFAISGRLLARLDVDAGAAPWEVLKAAIACLRAEGRLDLFAHLPVPLLRADDLTETLRATRRRLARETQLQVRRALPRAVVEGPSVSIVICTKDRCRLLSQLLDQLLAFPAALVRDIVIVTNAATDGFAADVHAHYGARGRVTLLRHEGPYNFSAQSNRGAAHCSGDLILFLNDDIVPIVPHWLDALRAPFARPEVGITGPLLFYPDESIQHAGMYLGFNGVAGHTLRGARLPEADYMLEASAPRNVSMLTGAALLTRRSLFEDLNGFDRQLGTYLQDVDYCLRVLNCDREIVYEPRACLFHMESVSMREKAGEPVFGERRELEHRHFKRKWKDGPHVDAFHNPNFDVQDESLRTLVRCPPGLR